MLIALHPRLRLHPHPSPLRGEPGRSRSGRVIPEEKRPQDRVAEGGISASAVTGSAARLCSLLPSGSAVGGCVPSLCRARPSCCCCSSWEIVFSWFGRRIEEEGGKRKGRAFARQVVRFDFADGRTARRTCSSCLTATSPKPADKQLHRKLQI
ncbi:hypothetical protein U9M48_004366 [Paspalum notatum var. saurae]|uniref:Uncharacterized protein n=1 Tax=Paspalum notatum var. saurae TaxID=547442 RepID=A0AAQ3PUX1_PASNO